MQSFGRGRARRWMTPPVPGSRQSCYSPVHSRVTRTCSVLWIGTCCARMEPKARQPKSSMTMDPFRVSTTCMGSRYDGQHVWFATGDKLNAFDPANGKMLRSIDVAAHAGTAFDGKHLFQIAEDRIQKDRSKDRPCARHDPGARRRRGLGPRVGRRDALGGAASGPEDPSDRSPNGGNSSHHRVQPRRHRGHLGRRRALARHLGR